MAVGQARPKIHRRRWSKRLSFLPCHRSEVSGVGRRRPLHESQRRAAPPPVRLVNTAVLSQGLASPWPRWLPRELQPAGRHPCQQGREAHGAERPATLCPGAPMSPLGVRVCSLGGRGTHLPAVPGSTGAQAVGRTLPAASPEEGLSEVPCGLLPGDAGLGDRALGAAPLAPHRPACALYPQVHLRVRRRPTEEGATSPLSAETGAASFRLWPVSFLAHIP